LNIQKYLNIEVKIKESFILDKQDSLYSVVNLKATIKLILYYNHEGARHCRKPLGRRKGLDIYSTEGLTKTRAFVYKSCQNLSSAVGFTKTRVLATKSCQNISSTVGFTKTRAFATKV
jgi:hypothetical protein